MPYTTPEAREVAGIVDSLPDDQRRWLRDLILRVAGFSSEPPPDPPAASAGGARVIRLRPRRLP